MAIAKRAAIEAEIAALDKTIGAARFKLYVADVALAEADEGAAAARAQAAAHALAAATGNDPGPPPLSPTAARAQVAAVRSEVRELEEMLAEFAKLKKERAASFEIATLNVRDACTIVVRADPDVAKATARATLEPLDRHRMLPSTPLSLYPPQRPAPPTPAAWMAWLTALERDADSTLAGA